MKYVRSGGEFQPNLVMGNQDHKSMARDAILYPTSAGHFRIVNGKVETFGKSVGLNMEPADDDAEIIASLLGLALHDKE